LAVPLALQVGGSIDKSWALFLLRERSLGVSQATIDVLDALPNYSVVSIPGLLP
jgi:hypothetical protein